MFLGGLTALLFTFSVENATVDATRIGFETTDATCIDSCTTSCGAGVWRLDIRLCVVWGGKDGLKALLHTVSVETETVDALRVDSCTKRGGAGVCSVGARLYVVEGGNGGL